MLERERTYRSRPGVSEPELVRGSSSLPAVSWSAPEFLSDVPAVDLVDLAGPSTAMDALWHGQRPRWGSTEYLIWQQARIAESVIRSERKWARREVEGFADPAVAWSRFEVKRAAARGRFAAKRARLIAADESRVRRRRAKRHGRRAAGF